MNDIDNDESFKIYINIFNEFLKKIELTRDRRDILLDKLIADYERYLGED
jgi:hypothetical protein